MSDAGLTETSPLARLVNPRRHGRIAGEAGVSVGLRQSLSMVLVQARRGAASELAAAVRQAMALDLPDGSRAAFAGSLVAVGLAPDQWLLLDKHSAGQESLLTRTQLAAERRAAVVDQSHGRVAIRVTGDRCREALCLGVPIDLHPDVFRVGCAAATRIAHINAVILRMDDQPTYDIVVGSSFAESFWQWLISAASSFGCEIVGPVD